MASTPLQNSKLNSEEHKRVLYQEILNNPEIVKSTSTRQEHPKAVVLAGQPGAGKGTLVREVVKEFQNNVVSIDPDELRKLYPNVEALQRSQPYTWSDITHEDASAWGKELRAEMIAQRKNILIDGTNPKPEVIQQLKDAGYEVEVRVVATHRVESTLGVEQRFMDSLDEKGFGRYVPPSIQEPIYNELPNSLDKVQEQFPDVRMRVYDRTGTIHYDSIQNIDLKPSVALTQARENTLTPDKLQKLSQSYDQQISQGQHMERVLKDLKVDDALIDTHLQERMKLNAQGHLEKVGSEVHQRVQAIPKTIQSHPVFNQPDEPRPLSQKLTPFQQAYQRDQLDQALEQKNTRPHSVDTKHINNVLQGEQKHSIEYQAEQAAKVKQIQLERVAEIHPQTAHTQNPHIAAKVAAGLSIAVDVVENYDNTRQAIRQSSSTQEQWVNGGAAVLSGGVKSTVVGSAAVVGGAAGVEAGPAGSFALGTAAAMGADKLYTDSVVDKGLKKAGGAVGQVGFNYISPEGRVLGKVTDLQEQISKTADPAKQRELQEQLARASHQYSNIHTTNQNKIEATHTHDASYETIRKQNPKYDIDSDTIDKQIDQSLKRGLTGREAVQDAWSNAITAQKSADERTLAKLNPVDREAVLKVFKDNPGATVDKSIELVEFAKDRNAVGMGRGEAVYQNALKQMEKANQNADATYGKDRHDRVIEQHKQEQNNELKRESNSNNYNSEQTHDRQGQSQKDMRYHGSNEYTREHKAIQNEQRYHGTYEKEPEPRYNSSPDKYVSPKTHHSVSGADLYSSQHTLTNTLPVIDPVHAELLARMSADPNFAQQISQLMNGQASSAVANVDQTTVAMSEASLHNSPAPAIAAEPIVLPRNIASLHEQITEKFGSQIAHLSEKDQQTAIALATHEGAKFMARSVDYVYINKQGDILVGFDNNKAFSGETNLKQVQNNDAREILSASVDLQQTQQQNIAMRQGQEFNGASKTL